MSINFFVVCPENIKCAQCFLIRNLSEYTYQEEELPQMRRKGPKSRNFLRSFHFFMIVLTFYTITHREKCYIIKDVYAIVTNWRRRSVRQNPGLRSRWRMAEIRLNRDKAGNNTACLLLLETATAGIASNATALDRSPIVHGYHPASTVYIDNQGAASTGVQRPAMLTREEVGPDSN